MVLAPIVRRLPAAVNTRRLKVPPGRVDIVERRIVRRIARRAGITKAISPQTLRHAFITSFDAGVPLRDVQEAASHADPRTTMRDDRARGSLDRHAAYLASAAW
jgi:integrase